MRNMKQVNACAECKKTFYSNRKDATFCSSTCRVKNHRSKVRGNGKTWNDVRPNVLAIANDLRGVSKEAYDIAEQALNQYGATVAEFVIVAAYEAGHAFMTAVTSGKS